MSHIVRMRLLGGFYLEYRNAPLHVPSQRLQTLLAYLACHRANPQPRQRLAFLLWPDSSETQAFTNLRTLLHRLRSALPDFEHILQTDAQSIAWRSEVTINLDVVDFEAKLLSAFAAQESEEIAVEQTDLERAVALYTGDFLPDCYDEWVLDERERLRQCLFVALERLTTLLEQVRAYSAAITYAGRLVQLDPLNEMACLALMRLHILNGERASALRTYHACASALHTELGVTPGPALRSLYDRILSIQTPSAPEASGQLVGRTREWQWVRATWEIAAAGQTRMLVLSGEAGIGKSRLAEELLRWAARQNILTAAAHCHASEGELTYAPIISWLSAEALRENVQRLTATDRSELARLIPELATPDMPPSGPLTEQWQRQRLFEALGRAVLGTGRPTLLMLDDLQWCATDTLEWLHFLLRMDHRAPLLIVGTVRMEEVDSDHPLTALLETLRCEDKVTEVALGGLSERETAELAGHLMNRPLTEEQSTLLYTETEGNPLFIVEMIRAGLSALPGDEIPSENDFENLSGDLNLPPVVRAVITRRLGQVTPSARTILDIASVIGHSFTFQVLARVAAVDEDTLLRSLDELWQRRIVRERGPEAYDFSHDKLRAVAYARLSATRQRVLHRRVAEALEQDTKTSLDTVSGHIAVHYERAGMPVPAAHYHQRAARLAEGLYANETALAHYRSALRLLADGPQTELAEVCDQMADLLHLLSRHDEARDLWQRAIELTPASQSIAQAHFLRKLGNAWRDQYCYDEARRAYIAAEAALENSSLDRDAHDALIQIAWERITTLYWLGQVDEMRTLIEQLRPLLEHYGSSSQRARLHQLSALALLRQQRYCASREAVEHAQAYLGFLEEAADTAALPAAHFQLGFTLLWASELTGAEEACTRALTMAEHSGDMSLQARSLTYLTVIARKRAMIDCVQALATRSLQIATLAQMPDYIGAAHGNLAWAAWRDGDLALAEVHALTAVRTWEALPAPYMFEWIARWPLIGLFLQHGNPVGTAEQARALLYEHQQRTLPELEAALTAVVQAADAHNLAAIKRCLEPVTGLAHEHGFL